ncbi:MAG: hypothetical protein MJY62_00680 [Bacteroidales bacterium]|nr:hypothetical protein [Bacteroidales bacterium]
MKNSSPLIILLAALVTLPCRADFGPEYSVPEASHDIKSLGKWGPYSKEYYGIAHIDSIQSGKMVEFGVVPGIYRRAVKVPCTLFETDVHPWKVSPDMREITYRHEIEWKDRLYVDVTYRIHDSTMVTVACHIVNNTPMNQNVSLQLFSRKTGDSDFIAEQTALGDGGIILKYPGIGKYYTIAWDYPYSEVRRFFTGRLEDLLPYQVHDHVRKDFYGDKKGCYTANFLRPITLAPQSDTTIVQIIGCHDSAREALAGLDFSSAGAGAVPERNFLPQAGTYAFGEQLIEATLLTNVVYPIDAMGEPIRHFCPGKHWNSLYTWDCGFIGWGMAEIDPYRGYEIIRQYTTEPAEKAPFVHHGTPLATQILAMPDVWTRLGSDPAVLEEIYPRLKRFYAYMSGPDFRMPSGLVQTWKIFYNSGGWDDYAPQQAQRHDLPLRDRTAPMVSTAYYIRCAKILRLMASHLGKKADVRELDADIKRMSSAILSNAWDPQSGYFGYVLHDAGGKVEGLYRTSDGVNYNMGLDGVTPLVAGIGSEAQKEEMLSHIFTEGELWSDCGITTVDRSAPYYRIDGYWNGTVWMPHQMILWKTMLDLGLPERARQIAFKALEKWDSECRDSYNCYEHFMIDSGRGGGWHNFSGLSSPMVNWFCAYFKPGTISCGFNALVASSLWSESCDSLKATLRFDKDAVGQSASVLVCLSKTPSIVTVGGKAVSFNSPYPGLVEIPVKVSANNINICIR